MYAATNWMQAAAPGEARWGFGIGCRGSVGQSELRAAALLKAVWWDLRLTWLLTHLLFIFSLNFGYVTNYDEFTVWRVDCVTIWWQPPATCNNSLTRHVSYCTPWQKKRRPINKKPRIMPSLSWYRRGLCNNVFTARRILHSAAYAMARCLSDCLCVYHVVL